MIISGQAIPTIPFAGAAPHGFGFEALRLQDVLARMGLDHFARPRRPAFYQVFLVDSGELRLEIDFVQCAVPPGSVAFVRPGQVQRLTALQSPRGTLLLAEPSFLTGGPFRGPAVHSASREMAQTIRTLHREYARLGAHPLTRQIVFHQVMALLLQLRREGEAAPAGSAGDAGRWSLFRRFETLLEESFATERAVAAYARRLGCTEKTLTRACHAAAGRPPKALIQDRVALEARRILVHTDRPVKEIAHELGFTEPTNFVKFFRQTTGELPAAFRAAASAAPPTRRPSP